MPVITAWRQTRREIEAEEWVEGTSEAIVDEGKVRGGGFAGSSRSAEPIS